MKRTVPNRSQVVHFRKRDPYDGASRLACGAKGYSWTYRHEQVTCKRCEGTMAFACSLATQAMGIAATPVEHLRAKAREAAETCGCPGCEQFRADRRLRDADGDRARATDEARTDGAGSPSDGGAKAERRSGDAVKPDPEGLAKRLLSDELIPSEGDILFARACVAYRDEGPPPAPFAVVELRDVDIEGDPDVESQRLAVKHRELLIHGLRFTLLVEVLDHE